MRGASGSLGKSLGSSTMLEAGVDTKLKEGEDAVLCRGELEDEEGSPKSGRYGLLGRVFMSADVTGDGWRAVCPNKQAFVAGGKEKLT